MTDDKTSDLVAQWRDGSQQAAAVLYERYAKQLVAMVRQRLSGQLARRIDPEDVIQSVYWCFFAHSRDGHFDVRRGGDLWHLLVTMALHKLNDKVKWHTSGKRAVAREQSFGSADSLAGYYDQLRTREPSPEEAASLNEELEQVMQSLPALSRRILQLRLQGYNLEEIAADNNCCQRTVIRILERIKQILTDWQSEASA
ncbi:MAG: RNA polymerase sigma factor [Gemmataceae bacterium]